MGGGDLSLEMCWESGDGVDGGVCYVLLSIESMNEGVTPYRE